LRIALTGSHGAGKTTLARALAEKLDKTLIADRARSAALETGVNHVRELREDRQKAMLFQYAVLVRQLAEEARRPLTGFVSDRSTLDFLAYWQAYGLPENPAYEKVCLNNRYDLLVYVPAEFPPEEDGFRDPDPAFQREVDRRIRELLPLVPWPVVRVSGTLEKRAAAVLTRLRELPHRSWRDGNGEYRPAFS